VNSSLPYSFTGAGSIGGTGSLIKSGSGSLLLGTTNSYTGGTFVNSGVLQVGNNFAIPQGGNVTVNSPGTLDLNTNSPTIVNLSGSGIVDTVAGGSPTLTVSNSADSTFSGVIQNTAGALALTKTGNGKLTLTAGNSFSGVVTVNTGTLEANPGNAATGRAFSFVSGITVNSGATLLAGANGLFGWDGTQAKPITVNAGGVAIAANGDQNVGIVILNGGTLASTNPDVYWGSWDFGRAAAKNLHVTDNSVVTAQIVGFHNGATIEVDGGKTLDFQGTIGAPSDGGSAVNKIGAGTLVLSGVNTYAGPTVINAGTLAGTGVIPGVLTNNATLAPGNGGIGTLTVNGNITLNVGSTNIFEVNGSTLAKDSIVAGAGVTYGGLLNIVPSGTFTAGQQFQLFSGTGATNTSNFASIAGNPGTGLGFAFTNGTLSVVAATANNPTNITFSVSGSTLSLSWPTDHLGWILQSQTNSLGSGLTTNWVDVAGSETMTSTNIAINAALPTAFYRLRHP
jgi:autotransporter-associated beta strand protein